MLQTAKVVHYLCWGVFNYFFNVFVICSRCLKGEGKIEKIQTKVLELQRKLYNKTAAVQELGKENQSLQVSRLVMCSSFLV